MLIKAGFFVSHLNFNDLSYKTFIERYRNYLKSDSQLRGNTNVVKLFSTKVIANLFTKEEKSRIFRAFRDLGDKGRIERLGELYLFKNKKGEIVKLKNLAKTLSHSVLNKFEIHPDEYFSDLNQYLFEGDDKVYDQLIYPLWKDVFQVIASLSNEDKGEIFESIRTYYEKRKDRTQIDSLSDHKLILFQGKIISLNFTEDEESNVKTFFWHKGLSEYFRFPYTDLQTLLNTKFNILIPDKDLVQELEKEPLKVVSDTLKLGPPISRLTASEYKLICELGMVTELNIFKDIVIINEDTGISSSSEGYFTQFYTENQKIIEYIELKSNLNLQLLPKEFSEYSKIVPLAGEKLIAYLIEQFDGVSLKDKLIEALLIERGELQRELFEKKISELHLDATKSVKEGRNFIYLKFLENLTRVHSETFNNEKLSTKIIISNQDKRIELKNIHSTNNSIKLKVEDSFYTLSVSKILDQENQHELEVLQKFASQVIQEDVMREVDIRKILKMDAFEPGEKFVLDFKKELLDGQVINGHQLAFILLSSNIIESEYSSFKLLAMDGLWYPLNNTWFVINDDTDYATMYNPKQVLDKKYHETENILGLTDHKDFAFGENGKFRISIRFKFSDGYQSSAFKEIINEISLFDHLLECWNLTHNENRKDRLEEEGWKAVFGYSTHNKVLSAYSIEKEKISNALKKWIDNEPKSSKLELLSNLGFVMEKNPIVQLRIWFFSKTNNEIHPIINFADFNPTLLENTLTWLIGKTPNNPTKFNVHSEKVKVINMIILQLLDQGFSQFPFPVYESKDSVVLKTRDNNKKYLIAQEDEYLVQQISKEDINQLFKTVDVVHYAATQYDKFKNEFIPLSFKLELIEENFREHTEPFYKKWQNKYNIKLFKKDVLDYKISFSNPESVDLKLGQVIDQQIFLKNTENDCKHIYYSQQEITLEKMQVHFKISNELAISEALGNLIEGRNLAMRLYYNFISSTTQEGFDENTLQAFKEALEKSQKKQERIDLIEETKSKTRYSYSWFCLYLKLLLTYKNFESSIIQKSISFQKLERCFINGQKSEKFFLLVSSNSFIPIHIEEFDDFKLTVLLKNQEKEFFTIQGVSKKGQNLLIYSPNGIPNKILGDLTNIVQISLSFSPVLDLLDRLNKAFTNEGNLQNWTDIKDSLPPVNYIYGPPGTGKTTRLCSLIEEECQINPFSKILVLTPTNKAADVLSKKLAKKNKEVSLIRVGNPTDPELEIIDDEIYKSSLNSIDLDSANVVASTIHRLPYFKVEDEESGTFTFFEMKEQWDFVIFDESSMIDLPYLVFAFMALHQKNPNTKFIIAGDPKQIPPVIDVNDTELESLEIEDENIYKMMEISSFKSAETDIREIDKMENLGQQYRSVPKIGELFNAYSYDGVLQHNRVHGDAKILPPKIRNLLSQEVTFIDFPLNNEDSIFRHRKLQFSSYHIYSAMLVSKIIKTISEEVSPQEIWNLGVISPYKAQALLSRKLLSSNRLPENINVICDTVHGFQGDECDIVFFIVNPNNSYYTGHPKSLLSKEYVYNVAISRARDYLVILAPLGNIKNNSHLNRLQIINNPAKIISSTELEQFLFGDGNFLKENSYLTGHDAINVFKESGMEYFVKTDNGAIDIQIGKNI